MYPQAHGLKLLNFTMRETLVVDKIRNYELTSSGP